MADAPTQSIPPVPLVWPEDVARKEYVGGCHCGRFRYQITHPVFENGEWKVVDCNCSMCLANGRLNIYVPEDLFVLTKGSWDELTVYQFKRKLITHRFCPTCGVVLTSSWTGSVAVSSRTVDGIELDKLDIIKFDGATLM